MHGLIALAFGLAGAVGQAAVLPVPAQMRTPGAGRDAVPMPEYTARRAITGDTIEFGGEVFRLDGLICPDTDTAAGRQAKALMNTLLRGPWVECAVIQSEGRPPVGACSRDGRRVAAGTDFAQAMRESGFCE